MRVLQLIDSLQPGGAERVAVNIANALSLRIEGSYLCASRKEGGLKESLHDDVGYLFVDKRMTLDVWAVLRLYRFVKRENISIIHAHSSSFFIATLLKLLNHNLKIVWHDHYGHSEFLEERSIKVLKPCSRFFNLIFSVNKSLTHWAKENLKTNQVEYLPNFVVKESTSHNIIALKGQVGKRIVCLANFRPQKNHVNLLKAFKLVVDNHPDWTLHLIGQDQYDAYSDEIKKFISRENLAEQVFIYGSLSQVESVLKQCEIGVLSSNSEGLPLSLLEYGLYELAVVTTNVGECAEVVKNDSCGFVVPSNDHESLFEAISNYIKDEALRRSFGLALKKRVDLLYSESTVVNNIIKHYSNLQ
ncbi:glycosyltransferase family 4 protein [Aestuariibaculum sediminum]|uniref:Glycosyltransferase family 4 protein n=1 Tax=Aestuariibaculum sediminum TaxID=2770637 RepID=A0A8J6QBR3_9FLAO|nr:glycosyltransferase family 4 protein [Aestuariibaculum sediminum]MBD0833106.1 glycosyltransferase family 4 protein [Aestuariibaculum sediminum]